MILSTQTDILSGRYGDIKAVEMIAKAGFDAIDYSMFPLSTVQEHPTLSPNYKKYALVLKEVASNNGVFFNQAHAPFPSYKEDDAAYSKEIKARIIRSIEFCGILGVKQICIHPVTFRNEEQKEFDFNLSFYRSLVPYAKAAGIKIAIENMFWRDKSAHTIRAGACGTSYKMVRLFESLDPECFTCLLDIGHCGLVGEDAVHFINALGARRLGALHVHDNDFKNDMHTLPFTRNLNWQEITEALKNIKYKGEFTFEADMFLAPLPDESIPDALKLMHSVGRQLISMIEK